MSATASRTVVDFLEAWIGSEAGWLGICELWTWETDSGLRWTGTLACAVPARLLHPRKAAMVVVVVAAILDSALRGARCLDGVDLDSGAEGDAFG